MYKSEAQEEWESSPQYHLLKFRNPETEQKEMAMEDFLFWIDNDSEYEITKETRESIRVLVNEYLEFDIDKVKRGELELLEKWKDAISK